MIWRVKVKIRRKDVQGAAHTPPAMSAGAVRRGREAMKPAMSSAPIVWERVPPNSYRSADGRFTVSRGPGGLHGG